MDSNIDKNSVRPIDANHTEDTSAGSNNAVIGDGANSLSPKAVTGRSVNDSIDKESHCSRDDDGRKNSDLGVHPIRQSYDNRSVHGGPSNFGRNEYDFGNPPNLNEFRHSQFQSFYNPFVHGGPSNYGRNEHDFGNRFQTQFNPNYFGGHSNYGRNDYDFGNPPTRNDLRHLQFQSFYNPLVHGGPSNYDGRYDFDVGYQRNRNDSGRGQFYSNDQAVIGSYSNQYSRYGYERNNSDFAIPSNRTEDRQIQLSNSQEGTGRPNNSSRNANENQDADSKIEHHKLKRKIIDLYKLRAPLGFSENSANFDKDDWVKVWYIGTEGYKLYQSQLNCPLCFKKITPQNRGGTGNLPRWELTPVKGHLERLHSERKAAQKGKESNNKKSDKDEDEEATKKQGDGIVQDPLVVDLDAPESLQSNLLSSPESLPESKSESSSESESDSSPESKSDSSLKSKSSDPESNSTEPDKTIGLGQKRKLRRKTNGKRIERDAMVKRKRKECPDWKKPGVEFAWVKFTSSSRFLPAFVFPLEKGKKKRQARQILTRGGELEEKKHEVDAIATPLQVEQTKKLPKTKPYLTALKQFNTENHTNFQ